MSFITVKIRLVPLYKSDSYYYIEGTMDNNSSNHCDLEANFSYGFIPTRIDNYK